MEKGAKNKEKKRMRPINFKLKQLDCADSSPHRKAGAFLFVFGGAAALIALATLIVRPILASGPSSNRILNYQLRLTDTNGVPVADGTKNVKLTFYTLSSGGTQLYTACSADGTPTGTPTAVVATFTNGTGTVLVGDTVGLSCASGSAVAVPASLFSNTAIYLGITVNADAEMTPRKRIVAQGYALNADLLDDLDTSAVGGSVAFIPATDGSGNLTLTKNLTVDTNTLFVDSTNNRVGVGTVAPATDFDVYASGSGYHALFMNATANTATTRTEIGVSDGITHAAQLGCLAPSFSGPLGGTN
ncbi:MAG: hypothetical protein RL272_18, partial [Candidatus Parcubacteria bacterium]